jgi:hypothetical protein
MKTRQRVILFLLGLMVGFIIHDPAYDSGLWFMKSIHLVPTKPAAQTVLERCSDGSFITTIAMMALGLLQKRSIFALEITS